jgi:hypothetical protein
MKNLIFVCGIIFSSCVFGSSQWINIAKNNDQDTFFIDMNSLQRSGNSVTFWVRSNYGRRSPYGDLSTKSQITINCRTRDFITRWFMAWDDIDNNGKNTSSLAPKDSWTPIAPDTVSSFYYETVCRR